MFYSGNQTKWKSFDPADHKLTMIKMEQSVVFRFKRNSVISSVKILDCILAPER